MTQPTMVIHKVAGRLEPPERTFAFIGERAEAICGRRVSCNPSHATAFWVNVTCKRCRRAKEGVR